MALIKGVKQPCPKCTGDSKVLVTYWSTDRLAVTRHRQCIQCRHEFMTEERFLYNINKKRNRLHATT